MRSWNDQASYGIRDAVARVAEKYGVMVDKNQGLPPSEFAPFLSAAGMQREPMANLTIQGWLNLLKRYGPLWVGTLGVVSPGTYLHSRIVEKEGLRPTIADRRAMESGKLENDGITGAWEMRVSWIRKKPFSCVCPFRGENQGSQLTR